jgi:hypothetical protein
MKQEPGLRPRESAVSSITVGYRSLTWTNDYRSWVNDPARRRQLSWMRLSARRKGSCRSKKEIEKTKQARLEIAQSSTETNLHLKIQDTDADSQCKLVDLSLFCTLRKVGS